MLEKVGLNCTGCAACDNKCPQQSITMKKDEAGFAYPIIDESKCTKCGLCETICPVLVDTNIRDNESIITAYSIKSKNKQTQESSSSGGVFSELAESILKKGGYVYGASFSEEYTKVRHTCITSREELHLLKCSKYVQSEIGKTYIEIKKKLDLGSFVLFSGTPCQIAGLLSFLGRKYDNLLAVEIICHGVPSPDLWKKYLLYLGEKHGSVIKDVSFRSKKISWEQFGLYIRFGNTEYFNDLNKDPFLIMFLRNLCLRESCYHCIFKQHDSNADITIGDFWGVKQIEPELYHNKGVSLVLIHSNIGKKAMEEIKDSCDINKVDYNRAIKENSAYYSSVNRPNERDRFFIDMKERSWRKLKKKYIKTDRLVYIKKAYHKLRRIV